MITTLIQLGKQLSSKSNEWADIIDIPKIDIRKENLVATIIFDLDQKTIEAQIVGTYQERSPFFHKNVSIKGGNNKASYTCCEIDKIIQIEKTFFGKIDNKGKIPIKGEFLEYLDNKYSWLRSSLLYEIVKSIFELRTKFLDEKWSEPETIIRILLGEDYNKAANKSKLVIVYISVISRKNGIECNTPISDLDGFDSFIQQDRFAKPISKEKKISYASGKSMENVNGVAFPNRYSLNYMFVETTLNYASGFYKNNFNKNYQINSEEQLYLERASERLLATQKITIADIPHCIIPQFLSFSDVNFENIMEETYKNSELLFQKKNFEESMLSIKDEIGIDKVYWLNFLAFVSDGNSFKTINLIKDVSKIHLETVLDTFRKIDVEFNEMVLAVNWQNVMTDYDYQNKERKLYPFNFQTIYQIIPQRKDKDKIKKNEALAIFKSILEKRRIEKKILFKHFTELILCHRFGRYKSYKNVKGFSDEYFDFAIQDAVFKYLAFFRVLKQLKLSDYMGENNQSETEEIINLDETTTTIEEYQNKVTKFFERMGYSEEHKALFYLGRMLSTVAYIQKDKKKTVLDKLNFNGMEKNDIVRLRISLIDKARQYDEIKRVIFNDANFQTHFNSNKWDVNPHEALFFILNGYSFGIASKS